MKRYDLGKNAKQFGSKQFWTVQFGNFDVWVSYNTAVAIVDNITHCVYLGSKARGYSATTSKQVTQALYKFACGYDVIAYGSHVYDEFISANPQLINSWGDCWCKYNFAPAACGMVKEMANAR